MTDGFVRSLADKTISKRGLDVLVKTDDFLEGGRHVFKMVFSTGTTTTRGSITLGAEDGPRSSITSAMLQQQLDNFRDTEADNCAWQESMHDVAADVL